MDSGIYIIENLANGKIYVGSSCDCRRRFWEHRSRLVRGAHINTKLQAAWNKYGESSFEFKKIASVLRIQDLESLEQQLIDDLKAFQVGYNLAPVVGTTRGWKAPPETRRRMSEAAKRRDHSVQVRAMAEATRGKKRPQYVLDAMREGKLRNPITEETRRKMSESAKARGDTLSPEKRARLAEITKARARYSDDQKRQMYEMQQAGAKLKEIGLVFGITAESSVSMNIRKWKERGLQQ